MHSNRTLQYCLTGNIGSGKTTVAREFERLGIPVYYADDAAKRLMHEDTNLRAALITRFTDRIYTVDNQLDTRYLSDLVFQDAQALADLNGLVHPAVHRDARQWMGLHPAAPFTLYEAAITLEIGRAEDFDGIIVVHAPKEERRRRVMLRDGATEEQFESRAGKQWPDDKKLRAANFVIENTGSDLLLPQILRLHDLLAVNGRAN